LIGELSIEFSKTLSRELKLSGTVIADIYLGKIKSGMITTFKNS